MKKLLVILMALIMVFALTACGEEGNSNQDNGDKKEATGWLATKSGQFYDQFKDGKMYMEYETEQDGAMVKIVTATNGKKVYVNTTVEGQDVDMIVDGQTVYTIFHDYRAYSEMPTTADINQQMFNVMSEDDVDVAKMEIGTREVDGKTYDSESWEDETGKSTLCFEGNKLVYMIAETGGETMTIKVLKASSDVNDSLFEIPEGYQKM